jgi:hypothetical protein
MNRPEPEKQSGCPLEGILLTSFGGKQFDWRLAIAIKLALCEQKRLDNKCWGTENRALKKE